MTRLLTTLTVAGLIAAGGVGDRMLTPTSPSPDAYAAAGAAVAAAPSTPGAIDMATEQAFALARPTVVYVNNVGVGSGSGVIYDATGDIVTNAHVVATAQRLTVTLSTGKSYPARLIGSDAKDDLAVIRIKASSLPAARFAPQGSFRVAQTVLAIGNPLGLQQSVTSGLISALNRTVSESTSAYLPDAIQTSAPINPGNSGGALVSLDGVVVGIPTLEATDPQNNNGGAAQGIGFAIPSTRVTSIAHQLIVYGRVIHSGRAYLGVSAADNSGAARSPLGLQGSGSSMPGALVTTVAANGPASKAGLQPGDVISAVNGTPVTGADDLLTALARATPGQTVTIAVYRGGRSRSLKVTLAELAVS